MTSEEPIGWGWETSQVQLSDPGTGAADGFSVITSTPNENNYTRANATSAS